MRHFSLRASVLTRSVPFASSALVLSVATLATLATGCKPRHFNASVRSNGGTGARPRLVVLIIVDQMRPDYVDRFRQAFKAQTGGEDGFLAFRDQGVWFNNARTAAAPTVTAAGHASICTGASPSVHGIVSNGWYDTFSGTKMVVESTKDETASTIGSVVDARTDALSLTPEVSSSAHRLMAPSISDELYAHSSKASKTVSLSLKDRGALFCGGKTPKGAYWHDAKTGAFVTSSATGATALPEWLVAFNNANIPKLKVAWTPAIPLATDNTKPDVEKYRGFLVNQSDKLAFAPIVTGTRDVPLARDMGEGFPYVPANDVPNSRYKTPMVRWQLTPHASDLLADLAIEAVEEEKLGNSQGVTDFLTVSFSSPDLVGHHFGSDSLELFDSYLRLNLTLAKLRAALREKRGDDVLWILTSDHGAQRSVESRMAANKGNPSSQGSEPLVPERFPDRIMASKISAHIEKKYGVKDSIAAYYIDMMWVNEESLAKSKVTKEQVVKEAYAFLSQQSGVKMVLSQSDLVKSDPQAEGDLSLNPAAYYRKGFYAGRTGDLVVVLKPGWTGDNHLAGNHGTVYEEDARIPMAYLGRGIKGPSAENVDVRANDIGPTMLCLLGFSKGAKMNGTDRSSEVTGRPSSCQ